MPHLPALLETLPVSDQEHIASILFNDQKNFRLWFAKSHGNESDYFRAITKPRGPFHEWENQWRLIERWRRSEAIRVY